jgi:hypothetical protein
MGRTQRPLTPHQAAAFAESLAEAFRQGARGPVHDMALLARPWGVGIDAVRVPVDIWHGEADTNVPSPMGALFRRRASRSATPPHAR